MGHPVENLPMARPTADFGNLGLVQVPLADVSGESIQQTDPLKELLYYDGRISHMLVWEGHYQFGLPDGHPKKLQAGHQGIDISLLNDRVHKEITKLYKAGHSHETEPMTWASFCDYINADEHKELRLKISGLRGIQLVFTAATEKLSRGWVMSIAEYASARSDIG